MSLDIGQDGVAGRQVTDTNAHKVFVHRRLPEQLIELRRRERERERVGGENGQTEEMINEAGNELHAITAASPIPEDCTLSLRKKLPLKLGCMEGTHWVWVHKLTFSCCPGINYWNKFSGGAKINVELP